MKYSIVKGKSCAYIMHDNEDVSGPLDKDAQKPPLKYSTKLEDEKYVNIAIEMNTCAIKLIHLGHKTDPPLP